MLAHVFPLYLRRTSACIKILTLGTLGEGSIYSSREGMDNQVCLKTSGNQLMRIEMMFSYGQPPIHLMYPFIKIPTSAKNILL